MTKKLVAIIKQVSVAAILSMVVLTAQPPVVHAATPANIEELQQEILRVKALVDEFVAAKQRQVLGVGAVVVTTDQQLLDAIVAARGGETILLAPGAYGKININRGPYAQTLVGSLKKSGVQPQPTSPVTITSQDPSNRAFLKGISLLAANNWRFENLVVYPDPKQPAVSLDGNNLVFTKNVITYGDQATWVANQDWYDHAGTALAVTGLSNEVSYNLLTGIDFGIAAGYTSEQNHIHHNLITNFSGDAMRILGNNNIIEHNILSNPTVADANHDDLFQSWSYDPVLKKVGAGLNIGNIVRYNTFYHTTENHPLRVNAQGIGLFDGPFKNWLVEHNLMFVDHYHGISMYGPIDSTIQNNVVVDPIAGVPGPVWVKFFNHKNGTPPENSRLLNNYSNKSQVATSGVTVEGNVLIPVTGYSAYFNMPATGGWSLKPGVIPFAVGAQLNLADVAAPIVYANVPAPVVTTPTTTTATTTTPTPTPVATTTPTTSTPTTTTATTTTPTPTPSTSTTTTTVTPTVSVTGLRNNANLTAPVLVTIKTNDFTVTPTVSYRVDTGVWQTLASPYQFTLDPALYTSGKHRVTVRAVAGATIVLKTYNFNVGKTTSKQTNNSTLWQTTDNINLRQSPAGDKITVVPKGTELTRTGVTQETDGGTLWAEVITPANQTGYVHAGYLVQVSTGSELLTAAERQAMIAVIQAKILELQALLAEMLQKQN